MGTGQLQVAVIALAACASGSAQAQEEQTSRVQYIGRTEPAAHAFKLSGSLRLAEEWLDEQFRPGFNRDESLPQSRLRLLAEWHTGNWRLNTELIDARSYTAEPGDYITTGEVNTLEPVQLFVGWAQDEPFGKGTHAAVQAGRFIMNIGSRRLVSSGDSRNTTSGYTGVRADLLLPAATQLTMFYVLPQQREPNDPPSLRDNDFHFDEESFDLQLWGVTLMQPEVLGPLHGSLTYVGIAENDSAGDPTRERNLQTFDLQLFREPSPGNLDFEIEAALQFGRSSANILTVGQKQDVAAGFLHAEAGYFFRADWKPRLSLEFERASGDGPGDHYTRYDTLYGNRRGDFGPSSIYSALGRTNIISAALRLEAQPSAQTDGMASFRAVWAESPTDNFSTTTVRDPSGDSGRFAGYQLEGRLRHWMFERKLQGEINGALLIKRGLLRDAPSAPAYGNTVYLSAALTWYFEAYPWRR
jgi:hypothetical protein